MASVEELFAQRNRVLDQADDQDRYAMTERMLDELDDLIEETPVKTAGDAIALLNDLARRLDEDDPDFDAIQRVVKFLRQLSGE